MEVEEGSDQKVALLLHLINVHVYSKESFLPFKNCADLMKLENFVTFALLTICRMRNRRFSKDIRAINFRFRKEDPQKVNKQRVLPFESRLFVLK